MHTSIQAVLSLVSLFSFSLELHCAGCWCLIPDVFDQDLSLLGHSASFLVYLCLPYEYVVLSLYICLLPFCYTCESFAWLLLHMCMNSFFISGRRSHDSGSICLAAAGSFSTPSWMYTLYMFTMIVQTLNLLVWSEVCCSLWKIFFSSNWSNEWYWAT